MFEAKMAGLLLRNFRVGFFFFLADSQKQKKKAQSAEAYGLKLRPLSTRCG